MHYTWYLFYNLKYQVELFICLMNFYLSDELYQLNKVLFLKLIFTMQLKDYKQMKIPSMYALQHVSKMM